MAYSFVTSIASELNAFKADGVARVLIVPGYQQYSATTATTASLFDAVYAWFGTQRNIPERRLVNR